MILVALGANLPAPDGTPPQETCRRAALALDGLLGLQVAVLSHWYETEPVPPSGQPPYVNGVARLEGPAQPAALLSALMALEAAEGRHRAEPNAARALDLDIIAMDNLVRQAPDPVLPHPRAHQRAFVLVPLRDVAPGWVHPVLGQTVDELLATLPPQRIRRL